MWNLLVLTSTLIAMYYAMPFASDEIDDLPVTCDRITNENINWFCPNAVKADIVVRIEASSKWVRIECNTSMPTVFAKLQHMEVGSIETVEFESCPIYSIHTIIDIFIRLGIRNVKHLTSTAPAFVA